MSANLTILRIVPDPIDPECAHRLRLRVSYWIACLATLAVFLYGYDYYFSNEKQRAVSPKHALLKPGGSIGLTFGIIGFVLFVIVYLYPIRKRWAWLRRQGSSRHWLDIHVLLGIVAPLFVTLHASFKFSGMAGMAYWIMIVVALSGIAGRYIYSQIPRTLDSTEMTLREAHQHMAGLASRIKHLGVLSSTDVDGLFRLPDLHQADELSLASALWKMLAFDLAFPLRMRRIRQKTRWRCSLVSFGRSPDVPIKRTILLVREQAMLTKKVFFLSKSRQMLRLWHVIHRPFSYSFAMLALLHVVLMVVFGYY